MTTYYTSTGIKVTKVFIDGQIRKCKARVLEAQKEEYGYNFCQECKTSAGRLDCSHNISVDECQKSGNSELAYTDSNVTVLCRNCHQKKDGLDVKLNWNK